jgi:hypothetical protein
VTLVPRPQAPSGSVWALDEEVRSQKVAIRGKHSLLVD